MSDLLDADELSQSSEIILFEVQNGVETPREVRDQVFALWSWSCQQNYREVARRTNISEATIRSWAKRDDWRVRYYRDRLDVAPEQIRPAISSIIHLAAINGAAYVDRVNAGEVEPNRAKLMAAKIAMDAAGFAPAHYQPGTEPKPKRQPIATKGMSPDQLLALELEYTEGKQEQ